MRLVYSILVMLLFSLFTFSQDSLLVKDNLAKISTDSLPRAQSLQEVVISASRVSEKQLTAPVSISKLSNNRLKQSASSSFFDAVGTMKAVQMIIPSMGFKVLNTRGFSNTTNVRFVQLIDNVDNQSPHIGAPIANALSPRRSGH